MSYQLSWEVTMLRVRTLRVLLAAFTWTALGGPAGAEPSPATDYAALWEATRNVRLEPDRAVAVENLKFDTGMAVFRIDEGIFFPAAPVGERTVEMVFIGRARLALEPPDEIEAGQLELFTGSPALEEEITEAALVITRDAATIAILGRPLAREVDPAVRARAVEIFDSWRERPERQLLGVEAAIFRDALGEALNEGYFAGWFRGDELGEFLYLLEPDAAEQVRLGQFTRLETTEKEERQLERGLHKAQRKGRLIGLSVDNLGVWDTWMSASRRDAEGAARPGTRGFEPRHYELDVALSGRRLELRGRARLHLTAQTGRSRVVKLEIHSDLRVHRAAVGEDEVFFHQAGAELADQLAELIVVLPRAPAEGDVVVVDLEYSGQAIDRVQSKSYALADTTHWYPHAGTVDRATYDVTLRWPEELDLVTGGKLVEGGTEDGGRRFERRRIEHPTFAVSFEIGKFRIANGQAGDVRVTLAVDALLARYQDKGSRAELLSTVLDALEYFEETFGPYPLDELTMVTAPRAFSQSFLGFVTLSDFSMRESSLLTLLLGFEDRRTVVAHELAHQWWGHVVTWQSYRDQWISEAMANYAAVLYVRHRLGNPLFVGPTRFWKTALTRTLGDGRSIESIGPLVLGERLASSRSVDAYQAIVYQKGAVVLDMLARGFGEKAFLGSLRDLVATVPFRPISTGDFIRLLERISSYDLSGFAEQFVYDTGLPQVYYSYEFSPAADGKWQVRGEARQQSPYRYAFRVVDRGGTLDVVSRRLDQTELGDSTLFVPVEIAVFNPEGDTRKRKGFDPRVAGNATVSGRMAVRGESSEFSFEVSHEPLELWLDRRGEVFGIFFNERRHPKRMLFSQGFDQAAAGEHSAAEDLYRRALGAEVFSGPSYGVDTDEDVIEEEGARLDGWIRLRLARLYLDQGRTADARATFDRLENDLSRGLRQELKAQRWVLEARLAIQEGDPGRAYELLNKKALRLSIRSDAEGLLLLAIAARGTGREEESASAVAAAKEKGAEVGVLEKG